jgi:hypothetical protein
MIARVAADLLVLIHFAFIIFVVLGGLLALKWWKVSFLHIPSALWGALIEFKGWICPLTPLEHYFRLAAGSAGYSGGFINHYIMPLIYPTGLTRELQVLLGITVLLINLFIYGLVLVNRAHEK